MANRPNSSSGKDGNCWWKWQLWKSRWWKSSASEDRLSSMSRWDIGHLLAETEDTLSATVSHVKWIRPCPRCAQRNRECPYGDYMSCGPVRRAVVAMNSKCSMRLMQPTLVTESWTVFLNSFSLNCHFGKKWEQMTGKVLCIFSKKKDTSSPQRRWFFFLKYEGQNNPKSFWQELKPFWSPQAHDKAMEGIGMS